MDPKIALFTIGTEITSGLEADTNSHYLSKELFKHSYTVQKHLSVPDDMDLIASNLKKLAEEFQIIIITGGIGPTEDDLTRESVALAFGLELEVDKYLFEALHVRHRDKHATKMASFPKSACNIKPSKGLIGGFYLKIDETLIISLPGVPDEVKAIMHDQVLPILNNFFLPKIHTKRLLFKIANLSEVQIEQKLKDIKGSYSYGLLPKLGEVHLYITVKADSANEALGLLQDIESQVQSIYESDLFAKEDQTLEETLVEELKEAKLTITLAESSTGGLIASRITSVAGSSEVFEGSFVTYSNDLKQQLGVEKSLLESFGAISEEVARSMAQNALNKADSDIALSVTGIAGPGGETEGKSVGLHYLAVLKKGSEPNVQKFVFRGNRKQVQWQASQQALLMIRQLIIDTK